MKFKVLDFELVTRHYKAYKEGIDKIEEYKEGILKRVEPLKKEMNNIIAAASGGIIVDNLTQQQRMEKFQKLQQEAMELDKEAKFNINKMAGELNVTVYEELEVIVNEYCKENDVDLLIGKMEVVFVKEEFEVTNEILDILKERELWCEYVEAKTKEKEKESV